MERRGTAWTEEVMGQTLIIQFTVDFQIVVTLTKFAGRQIDGRC